MQGSCGSEGTGSIYLPFPYTKRLDPATGLFTFGAVVPAASRSPRPRSEQRLCYHPAQSHGRAGDEQIGVFQQHFALAAHSHQAETAAPECAKVVVPVTVCYSSYSWEKRSEQ